MDDRWPQLIGLLLAGGVVLLNLRGRLGGTPRGERLFQIILVVFLAVAAGALFLLLRERQATLLPKPAAGDTSVASVDAAQLQNVGTIGRRAWRF